MARFTGNEVCVRRVQQHRGSSIWQRRRSGRWVARRLMCDIGNRSVERSLDREVVSTIVSMATIYTTTYSRRILRLTLDEYYV